MHILPDAKGNTTLLPESAPAILQLDITGVIGNRCLNGDLVDLFLRSSRKGLMKKDRVKALLLHIDSPGGTVVDSNRIYRAILEYKQTFRVPVYAYVSGLCASGGYYIACGADKIYTTPVSIIGSVGVKFPLGLNFSKFLESHGIDAKTLTEGKYKEKYPMFTPLPKEGEGQTASYSDLIQIIKESYSQFVDLVVQARQKKGLTKDLLEKEFGAQVYIASSAEKKGYVDQSNASYASALSDLAKEAQLDKGPYQVIKFCQKRNVFEDLFTNKWSNNTLLYYYDPNGQ